MQTLTIIGGGLAGCEAAYQAAQGGAKVRLFEMRPKVSTKIHQTDDLAELVCSNSLKSNALDKASGLLKWEMRRLDSLIIAAADASSVRFGVIHKNIFLNSPSVLRPTFQSQIRDDLFFAGQLTGVEGYVESAAAGLMAGINAARVLAGEDARVFPRETVLGSLAHYITCADAKHFQPMNSNWALLPPLEARESGKKWKKEEKPPLYVERGQRALEGFVTA